MVNTQHLETVLMGPASIRKRERRNPGRTFNLSRADFSKARLSFADLRISDLSEANLVGISGERTPKTLLEGSNGIS